MIRIVCGLTLLVMIVATTARAQTETIEANPDIFVNAINAIEKKNHNPIN